MHHHPQHFAMNVSVAALCTLTLVDLSFGLLHLEGLLATYQALTKVMMNLMPIVCSWNLFTVSWLLSRF